MSVSRIAKRYAKPILDLAEDQKKLDQVKSDMQNFDSLCHVNSDLVNLLKSPIISHLKKAEILKKIFSKSMSDLTLSAFDIITRKNREAVLPDIAREFLAMYNEKKGVQQATVTTTVALDEKLRKSFATIVKDVTGKEPLLEEKIDANLLGGYTLTIGDQQIDESVSGKLKDLKLKFNKEK